MEPNTPAPAHPVPGWRELFLRNESYYRAEAARDPFQYWETGRFAESAEIDLLFGYGVTALLAGNDPVLARPLFARTVRFGERMRTERAVSADENYLRPTYEARNFACEVIARLFVTGAWDARLSDDGLERLVGWCLDLDPPRRWDDVIGKPHALRAIRMALIAGRQDVFARLQSKMKRMKPLDEMPLWREVAMESDAGRQAQLVREYIEACPKGGTPSYTSSDGFQLELALVHLRLAGVPFSQITLEAVARVVLAEAA
ncbi:MAG: hypothetical protein AB7O37_11380 [Vicinamibacteria bacterium]